MANSKRFQSEFWGIDVGGANLKMCSPGGRCAAKPFPMWTDYERLSDAVVHLIAELSCDTSQETWNDASQLAITMTGELSDCFETRRSGVATILDQLTSIVPESRCQVYSVEGRWLSAEQAKESAWSVAASNWHALATWCLSQDNLAPGELTAIIDVGSTTMDIIPVHDGQMITSAKTDRQRLVSGELIYTGMERTPIHAIVRTLKVDGVRCPLMAERFATIVDANLVLGSLPEDPDNVDTADGRPRTRRCALSRLARMVGEDSETLSEPLIVEMARQICYIQARQVARALWRKIEQATAACSGDSARELARLLVSGHGRPLVERLKKFRMLKNWHFDYLEDSIGANSARCAPALAVSQLCAQHVSFDCPDSTSCTQRSSMRYNNLDHSH